MIYNAFTLKKVKQLELTNAPEKTEITQLCFSNKDIAMAVCGSNGYVAKWKMPSFERIG